MGKAVEPLKYGKATCAATARSSRTIAIQPSDARQAAAVLHRKLLSTEMPESFRQQYEKTAELLQRSGLPAETLFDVIYGAQLQTLGRRFPEVAKLTQQYYVSRAQSIGAPSPTWQSVHQHTRESLAQTLAQAPQNSVELQRSANKIIAALNDSSLQGQGHLMTVIAATRCIENKPDEIKDMLFQSEFVERHRQKVAPGIDSALVYLDEKDMDLAFGSAGFLTPDGQYRPDSDMIFVCSTAAEQIKQAFNQQGTVHLLNHEFVHTTQAGKTLSTHDQDVLYLQYLMLEGATEKRARDLADDNTVMPPKPLHPTPVKIFEGMQRYLAVKGHNPDVFLQTMATCAHEQRLGLTTQAICGTSNPSKTVWLAKALKTLQYKQLPDGLLQQAVVDLCQRANS